MQEKLKSYIEWIKQDAENIWSQLYEELGLQEEEPTEQDEEVLFSKFEETWREQPSFHKLIDEILQDIEKRFEYVLDGKWSYNRQDWPESWTFSTLNRDHFVGVIRQMTSNFSHYFGKLLTPLVEGIRIKGRLQPTWWEGECPKLVLMDGEGLLHKADSHSSLPTRIVKQIEEVDAVLLVDNAKSLMQTAPTTILKHLSSSGHASKLHICFTHFDSVTGDNLPSTREKTDHIISTLHNAIANIASKVFFVGGIHKVIDARKKFTLQNLNGLVYALQQSIIPPEPIDTKPIYDGAMLSLHIQKAATGFHRKWDSTLGFKRFLEG